MRRKGESVNPIVQGVQRALFETSGFPPAASIESAYEIEGWGRFRWLRRMRLRRFERIIHETAYPLDMLYQVISEPDMIRVVVGGQVSTVQTFLHILERKL